MWCFPQSRCHINPLKPLYIILFVLIYSGDPKHEHTIVASWLPFKTLISIISPIICTERCIITSRRRTNRWNTVRRRDERQWPTAWKLQWWRWSPADDKASITAFSFIYLTNSCCLDTSTHLHPPLSTVWNPPENLVVREDPHGWTDEWRIIPLISLHQTRSSPETPWSSFLVWTHMMGPTSLDFTTWLFKTWNVRISETSVSGFIILKSKLSVRPLYEQLSLNSEQISSHFIPLFHFLDQHVHVVTAGKRYWFIYTHTSSP